jgi:two-component system, NtrC family, nitrogen regulation sensor histidine kinase NtrY
LPHPPRRHPELTRFYVAVLLAVLSWVAFSVYRQLSRLVESGLDATSKWSLMAVGLLNTLVIASLLFIVIRILGKLYFERRQGILGARIRTKLVLALLAVGIVPSLLLYFVGRDFISKNIDRWFRPETARTIQAGSQVAEAFRQGLRLRLDQARAQLPPRPGESPEALRLRLGLDLVASGPPGRPWAVVVSPGLRPPPLPEAHPPRLLETPEGTWYLAPPAEPTLPALGLFVPKELGTGLVRLERQALEAAQLERGKETLQTLPKQTFLALTLFSIFAGVWAGLTLARSISEPVQELADAAHQVGTGDLDVQLPREGKDEFAFLFASFNHMIEDLRTSRMAIEDQSERIERQRAYLGQLLEALPVGVLSWQADGELRTFNPLARTWFGVEAWEVGQAPWRELSLQPRFGGIPALLSEVRRSRRASQEELRIGGEGEGRPVRAMVVPLEGGGELAVLEDLSALAQAEKRAAWQEVARRMAHEVKNPLTPIKLTAQRLLRRAREGRLESQRVQEGAETILTEVTSLLRLVDSFSEFAKLPVPVFHPLEACDLVRQVAALYAPNHPEVAWDLDLPDHPVPVQWDGDMVKRVLINLVDNALSALEDRGAIRVALAEEGARLLLSVEDDGPGVSLEARARLFEPYFSTKKKGTGLGLAIVKRIAQDHGGEAHHAALERGSRFWVSLPPRARA